MEVSGLNIKKTHDYRLRLRIEVNDGSFFYSARYRVQLCAVKIP